MAEKRVFYCDRSRIEAYQKCPQKRYNAYHREGIGIVKDSIDLSIEIGICTHEGIAELLSSVAWAGSSMGGSLAEEFVDRAVNVALARLECDLRNSSFDLESLNDNWEDNNEVPKGLVLPNFAKTSDDYVRYLANETKALVELLVRGYALAPNGLAKLLEEYEVLEVEREDTFVLATTDDWELHFMARPDALLRRRSDGALVVFSLKTTKKVDSRKSADAENDMQGMSEVRAVEARLAEWNLALNNLYTMCKQDNLAPPTRAEIEALTGIPTWFIGSQSTAIEGVQMLYLQTSTQKKNGQGFTERQSGILRPWRSVNMLGDAEFAFSYKYQGSDGKNHTLGKDWQRVNCWELEGYSVKDYIEAINGYDEHLNGNPLDTLIVQPEIHRREPQVIDRWLREVTAQESRIAEGLVDLDITVNGSIYGPVYDEDEKPSVIEEIMSRIFPHHSNACNYPGKCSYCSLCWGNGHASEAPLEYGFVRRTPHHEPEAQALVNIERR